MPYVRCPGCALDTYSAAGHSTTDACPRCGSGLSGGARWTSVDGVLVLRRRLIDPAPESDEGAPAPTRGGLATPSAPRPPDADMS